MENHPSRKLPQDRRKRIFRVAAQEFATHGFKGASLNRIIASVGMSKSSFYHYFRNKRDLFAQILDDALGPFVAAQASFDFAQLTQENFWPMIERIAAEMSDMANQSPQLVLVGRMFYRCHENPLERELTSGVMDLSVKWLTGLIRRGQELGLLRCDLPESFLIDLLMTTGMSIDRWFLEHWDELSPDERAELNAKAFDLFRRLLEPRQD